MQLQAVHLKKLQQAHLQVAINKMNNSNFRSKAEVFIP
jgi:hypothetical protein